MSLIPSSKGTTVLVALVITLAAVGTVAAVQTKNVSAPDQAKVGQEVTAKVTITDLYQPDSDWTLQGTTQLQNVTNWKVTKTYPNGTTASQTFGGTSQFEVPVNASANFASITISITGDAPPVSNYSYDPPQQFQAAKLVKVVGDGQSEVETVSVHHYTSDSKQARQNIQDAEDAVSGTNNGDAKSYLQNAIDWYNTGNFEKANSNAKKAKNSANQAKSSQNTMQLVLYAIGAIVILALIGGGLYYYRNQQQDSYDKLR
ncbi:MAG: hypothetical protein ABEI57_06175 [Halapricum sp.]